MDRFIPLVKFNRTSSSDPSDWFKGGYRSHFNQWNVRVTKDSYGLSVFALLWELQGLDLDNWRIMWALLRLPWKGVQHPEEDCQNQNGVSILMASWVYESWFSKSLKLDQSYRRCYSNYSAIWIDIFNFCSFLTLFVRLLNYLQLYALNQCREVTPWFSWSLRSSSAVLPKSILTYLGFYYQKVNSRNIRCLKNMFLPFPMQPALFLLLF